MHQFQLNLVTVISTGPPSSVTLDESRPQPMFRPDTDFWADHPSTDNYVVSIPFLVRVSDDPLTDQGICERVGRVAIHVLENDEDPAHPDDPDALTVEDVTTPLTSGTTVINGVGTITYAPYDAICNTDENYMKDAVADDQPVS